MKAALTFLFLLIAVALGAQELGKANNAATRVKVAEFEESAISAPAQESESLPTIRILPADVVQSTIRQVPSPAGTNKFAVMWTYTEAGARKMLAFWRAHAGERVLQQVGDFESRPIIGTTTSPNWTGEGWLNSRTAKFYAVTEQDAGKIVSGLKGK